MNEREQLSKLERDHIVGLVRRNTSQHLADRLERALTPPQASPASVAIPTNADQATLMVLLGEAWLREHAPERLKPQASPATVAQNVAACLERAGESPEDARRIQALYEVIDIFDSSGMPDEARYVREMLPQGALRDGTTLIDGGAK